MLIKLTISIQEYFFFFQFFIDFKSLVKDIIDFFVALLEYFVRNIFIDLLNFLLISKCKLPKQGSPHCFRIWEAFVVLGLILEHACEFDKKFIKHFTLLFSVSLAKLLNFLFNKLVGDE